MDENNLVTEIYPEEIQSLNPYDISYIAMKNGSIIMVIDKTPPIVNRVNNYYYREEKKEQNSPNFNIEGKKYISYVKEHINQKEKKYPNNNMNMNIYNEENNFLNYSFRSSDEINQNNYPLKKSKTDNNYINYNKNEMNKKYVDKNPYLIEKRKYIFYKKSNNEKKENINNNFTPLKHSRTFSYTISTPTKRKINNIDNIENTSFRKKYSNNLYDNISIRYSKFSSKKNNPYKNSTYDSIRSYGYIKSKSESININNNCKLCYKPKIEYTDDFILTKNSVYDYQNHSTLNDSMIKTYQNNFRAKTPIYTMRDLGRKNHRKIKINKNLELKKCLSKDNHKYYERKELSAPKKSNYFQKRTINGSTVHVFENNYQFM